MTPENIEGRTINIQPNKRRKTSIVLRVAAALGTVAASSTWGCRENAMDEDILNALSGVCQGQGVSQAAEYKDDQELNPVVILDLEGKKHPWTNKVPKEWRPLSVEDTELVACMDRKQQEDMIQDCDYNIGPNVKRYQYSVYGVLVEAATGKKVEAVELEGSSPDYCKQWEEISETRIDGSRVSFQEVEDWLRKFVE